MKQRVKVYIPEKLQSEINYLAAEYKVSPAYILQVAYKLVDRNDLQRVLSLNLIE